MARSRTRPRWSMKAPRQHSIRRSRSKTPVRRFGSESGGTPPGQFDPEPGRGADDGKGGTITSEINPTSIQRLSCSASSSSPTKNKSTSLARRIRRDRDPIRMRDFVFSAIDQSQPKRPKRLTALHFADRFRRGHCKMLTRHQCSFTRAPRFECTTSPATDSRIAKRRGGHKRVADVFDVQAPLDDSVGLRQGSRWGGSERHATMDDLRDPCKEKRQRSA